MTPTHGHPELRSAPRFWAVWCSAVLLISACGHDSTGDDNTNENHGIVPVTLCGDGVLQEYEECDDGAANDDFVPGACRTQCVLAYCGDWVVDEGEYCDEGFGNGYPGVNCRRDCTPPVCGDGEVGGGETCDDGNLEPGDGCSPGCEVEARWECYGSPSICTCTGYYHGEDCTGCVVLVSVDAGGETLDGETWSTAFRSVQRGVDAAADAALQTADQCEVWVARGEYFILKDSLLDTLALRDNTALYGGFAGTEGLREQRDPGVHTTVLDGRDAAQERGRVFHVVTATDVGGLVLDGFTIRWGHAIGLGDDFMGGGLLAVDATGLHVESCRFEDNRAAGGGAGIYLRGSQTVSLVGNTFVRNTGADYGGGLSAENSEITSQSDEWIDNEAGLGGGMYATGCQISLSGSRFLDNWASGIDPSAADGAGGGLFATDTDVKITDGLYAGNLAQGSGGAVSIENQYTAIPATILRTDFIGNATRRGGAVFTDHVDEIEMDRCLFAGNFAREGAALLHEHSDYVEVRSSAFLGNGNNTLQVHYSPLGVTSSTFAGNSSGRVLNDYVHSHMVVRSSVLWGNVLDTEPTVGESATGSFDIEWSLWPGGDCGVNGVLCDPPGFVGGEDAPLHYGVWSEVVVDPETRLTTLRVTPPRWVPDALRGKLVRIATGDPNSSPWFPIIGNDADSLWIYGRTWRRNDGNYPNSVYQREIYVDSAFAILDVSLDANSPAIDAAYGVDLPPLDLDGNPRVDVAGQPDQFDCTGRPGCVSYGDLGCYEYQP